MEGEDFRVVTEAMNAMRVMKTEDECDMNPQEVLSFWFDGNLDHNYKTKWFPTSSRSLQQQADETITTRFSKYLQAALNHELDHWLDDTSSTIALIIVLDQFSRHIYRQMNLPAEAKERVLTDQLALSITEKFIASTSSASSTKDLQIDQFVFSLMPFRHSATVERLQFVLNSIDEKIATQEKYSDLLNKFRKQTLRRLQHLQDRSAAQEAGDILEHHEFQSDETDILSHPLVQSTKQFLEKYIQKQRQRYPDRSPVVSISLSGGVDSMVIAKILALLRSHFNLRELFSMHIDYSNRDESKQEAAFVRDWAERHGFTHFERVISEVKRGVTDRAEYEKISRNLRYGFYKEILTTHMGWIDQEHAHGEGEGGVGGLECGLGVIFGHHAGDVQENVLSNIMRGCSPLSLAGMHEVGITEGVPVWRPLLKHVKEEIFEFAHRYGTPYFRDTTPTWSTRGKLRRQLVPLLIDMYGTGSLRNISSLAAQSDEAMTLVSQNIYDPFMRTVQRYPCGLVFNVLPHRHQPLCFWKEMLKNLMHSMSMNMIREKAVLNFLKRIQLVTHSSEVSEEKDSEGKAGAGAGRQAADGNGGLVMQVPGDLIIFRDGVVSPAVDEREEKERKGKEDGKESSVAMAEVIAAGLQIGSWKITAQELPKDPSPEAAAAAEKEEEEEEEESRLCEDDVDEIIDFQNILNGQFCYLIEMPLSISCLCLLQQKQRQQGKASSSVKPLGSPALWNLDSKLRAGLPLLVSDLPSGVEAVEGKGKSKRKGNKDKDVLASGLAVGEECKRYAVKYVFSPQT